MVSSRERRKNFLSQYVGSLHSLRIADVGCGPGSIVGLLPPDCYYVGVDVNYKYIRAAKRMYPNRIFLHGDVRALKNSSELPVSSFDCVLAFSLLHHLKDDDAKIFLRQAARLLRPDGFLLTVDGALTKPQNVFARWIITHDRGSMVRTPERYEELLSSVFATCRSEVRTDLLRIPYTHYICKASHPR